MAKLSEKCIYLPVYLERKFPADASMRGYECNQYASGTGRQLCSWLLRKTPGGQGMANKMLTQGESLQDTQLAAVAKRPGPGPDLEPVLGGQHRV